MQGESFCPGTEIKSGVYGLPKGREPSSEQIQSKAHGWDSQKILGWGTGTEASCFHREACSCYCSLNGSCVGKDGEECVGKDAWLLSPHSNAWAQVRHTVASVSAAEGLQEWTRDAAESQHTPTSTAVSCPSVKTLLVPCCFSPLPSLFSTSTTPQWHELSMWGNKIGWANLFKHKTPNSGMLKVVVDVWGLVGKCWYIRQPVLYTFEVRHGCFLLLSLLQCNNQRKSSEH